MTWVAQAITHVGDMDALTLFTWTELAVFVGAVLRAVMRRQREVGLEPLRVKVIAQASFAEIIAVFQFVR